MRSEIKQNPKYYPCPYCKGKGGEGSRDWAYLGIDPREDCGACNGTGDGRVYSAKRQAAEEAEVREANK